MEIEPFHSKSIAGCLTARRCRSPGYRLFAAAAVSRMGRYHHVCQILFIIVSFTLPAQSARDPIQVHNVQQWAHTLGVELWWFGKYVTRRDELLHKYKQHADFLERSGSDLVEPRKGAQLVQEFAKEVKNMMDLKISAVKRIMDAAENTAMSHHDEVVLEYEYWNAKLLAPEGEETPDGGRNMVLNPNSHFYNIPVNTSCSTVHVPTNVFDKAPNVLRAIKWSENLDNIFTNNYRMDPSLSWQYFGSSYGFMRQYPAMQWKFEHVDLYDCRTRGWYIEAATSAKDVIILVDFSGSMTGSRVEIARHVVNNILDTLGNNDFVNIFTFSEETQELEPCFKDTLLQATLGNVRELKMKMEELETQNIANFTNAFTKAFELLEAAREEKIGSNCNQAIMLVTDGVPFNYEEIFAFYNWRELPLMPVRVFTYLIGLEVPDVRQVKWMACENRGYYVHLSTLAEVREQVLNYIQVMARPMVLHRTEHPVIWTPVYADVTDPKMTDWLWELKERAEQKERFESYRKNKRKFNSREEQDRRFVKKLKRTQDQSSGSGTLQEYQLMTSVSMPVFDRRENANITERILVNEAFWVKRIRETRVANLLGVAGTDVPIQDILKLLSPHLIGVNGYAFIITNNGFVLTHPDLRPVFQGILKPSYNSVDLSEVELTDTDDGPRELSEAMKNFRNAVINQATGMVTLDMRYHFDDMRRVARMQRHFFYTGIESTPFTLIVSLPDQYGTSKINVKDMRRTVGEGIQALKGKNWRVHPEWIYCKYHYDTEHPFETPEQELLHFLNNAAKQGWRWLDRRLVTPPENLQANATDGKADKVDKNSYFCDRPLIVGLLLDAKITEGFSQNLTAADDQGKELKEQIGITVSFVSTHSGLTRWHDSPLGLDFDELNAEGQFSDTHTRAIDEIWYKRAVEQHLVQPESFVYSVPHDVGYHNDTLVTASHALFLQKAPVAVVGFQFLQSALFSRFMNITSKCGSSGGCHRTCGSENVTCYLIDNHGYIVLGSRSLRETGHFFGEVEGYIMQTMVDEGIFQKIVIYDYQAVCFKENYNFNAASILNSPRQFFSALIDWTIARFFWLFMQTNLQNLWHIVAGFAADEAYPENYADGNTDEPRPGVMRPQSNVLINRTRPQPCDQEVELYQLMLRPRNHSDKTTRPADNKSRGRGSPGTNNQKYDPNGECARPFLVELVDASNMLLVVVDQNCEIPDQPMTVVPTEVKYGNDSNACYRLKYNILPRKRLASCINQHPREKEIELCGHGNICRSPASVVLFLIIGWLLAMG